MTAVRGAQPPKAFSKQCCLVYTYSYIDQQDTHHATYKAKECYFLDQADNFSCTGHSFYILYTSSEGLGSLCWIRILIMCQCQNLHTSLSCTEYFSAFYLFSDFSSDPLPQLRQQQNNFDCLPTLGRMVLSPHPRPRQVESQAGASGLYLLL